MASLDLRERIKHQIMTQVVKGVKTASGWKVLIVDKQALRMISSCCQIHDLADDGVAVVEDLYKIKQPMISHEAVYLMAPSDENIGYLNRDFETKQRYKNVHIFFIDAASDETMAALKKSKCRHLLKGVTELNMSFVPAEPQVFTLDKPNGLHEFYSPNSPSRSVDIAAQLASLCAALGECPVVRYSNSSTRCKNLAIHAQDRINELKEFEPDMQSAAMNKRSQLLILDRNIDMQSPFAHELTYQAAAYDLCPIIDGIYAYDFEDGSGKKKLKKVLLGNNDELWDEFRHSHISNVFKSISEKFAEFKAANQDTKSTGQGKFGTKELQALMKALPQHQEKMAQFSLHLNLAERIMRCFTENIENCTRAEQNIVMKEDENGNKVKDYIGEVSRCIADPQVGNDEKIRLLSCAVVSSNGLPSNDLIRCMDLAEIPQEKRKALYNLKHFDIQVENDKQKNNKKAYKRRKHETVFNLSRWVPVIKDVAEDAIQGKLNTNEFPAVKNTEIRAIVESSGGDEDTGKVVSARKGRGGWAKGAGKATKGPDPTGAVDSSERQRLIIFIPGAISYNEIRTAYELSEKYGIDVVIGSHGIKTPTEFVSELQSLDVSTAQANANQGDFTLMKGTTMPYTEASF